MRYFEYVDMGDEDVGECMEHGDGPDYDTRDEEGLDEEAELEDGDMGQDGKPVVTLVGEDGNAWAIMSRCQRAARRFGWSPERIQEVMDEMKAGDYDHLLQTAMKHFDVR